jgi:large subunit ribosomal protein L28
MAKTCEMCGKGTVAGKRIQHHHSIQWRMKAPKTNRVFKPNLRNVKVDLDGKVQTLTICMKCYKRMRKDQPEVAEASKAQVA